MADHASNSYVRSFDWEVYGQRVLNGEIPVSKWTRLGVQRHFKDMETAEENGYIFSDAHAQHALESFLFLRHSKGAWAGKQFVLSDWQLFWIAVAFGWLKKDGTRRFRYVWEEVPRKNGKSTKLAGIGIYLFWFDAEGGAEVYTAATKMEQAKITHAEAMRMVQSSPHLRKHIGVKQNLMYNPDPGHADLFSPLGRDSKSLDGLNPHGAILDEVHAHPNREIYDVIDSGMGARSQPLMWMITTAGFDLSSFGYEQHQYAQKVLEGILDDPEFLAIVYTVDDPKKWDDPVEWRKANPNLGISVYEDGMASAAAKAKRRPRDLANFLTKRLNVWLAGGSRWLDAEGWAKCGDRSLRIEDFKGEQCWLGLDLAEKNDFAVLCIVFKRYGRYYGFFRLFHNEDFVKQPENKHLAQWAEEGFIKVNDGNATDFELIREEMIFVRDHCDIQEAIYDPKFSPYFAQKVASEDDILMVEMSQTSARFTSPIIEIENLVLTGDFVHDGNPVVAWMISNVVMRESKFSGLKHPTKEKPENKIDAAIALIQSMSRALTLEEDEPEPGIVIL